MLMHFVQITLLALLFALLTACGSPTSPELDTISELPATRHLLINADLSSTQLDDAYLVLQPSDPSIKQWVFRDLSDSSCFSREDYAAWHAATRTLMIGGCFGGESGLHGISASGQITTLAILTMTQREGSLIADLSHRLRNGAVMAPSDVSLKFFRHANQRDAFAAAGTIFLGEPGRATPQTSIYLFTETNEVTVYGSEWAFSEISHLDWSPDDRLLSFVGTIRDANELRTYAYWLDLVDGTITQLSAADVLIDSAPRFTPSGALVFTASEPGTDVPALYVTAPGMPTATAAVALDWLPNRARWRGAFVLAPDGQQVAFTAQRDNPTTPWTIYAADLATGNVRDLLPSDLAITRSGPSGADNPMPQPLNWDAAGSELVFSSNHGGSCTTTPAGGVVCTRHLYTVGTSPDTLARLSETQFNSIKFALWVE
jgi:Tol biopolymer transport system component